jgi:hypothetical protein
VVSDFWWFSNVYLHERASLNSIAIVCLSTMLSRGPFMKKRTILSISAPVGGIPECALLS